LADIPAIGLVASAALRWIFTPTGDPLHFLGDWLPAILKRHATKKITICSGALTSSMVWLACACQGCPIIFALRCAPVVRFAAPPLTGAGEPKTWLVRLLRRDCWLEFLRISF
jgi:hypothetical protein